MYPVFDLLRRVNVLGRDGPRVSAIDSLSLREFVDLAQELEAAIRSNHKPVAGPVFSHSAYLQGACALFRPREMQNIRRSP
jgi:hypothetical protein